MIRMKRWLGLLVILLLQVCSACQAVSVTPEPSSTQTQTEETMSSTQTPLEDVEEDPTPTAETQPTTTETPTPQPTVVVDGPWIVYPAPDGGGLHAYDVESDTILEISLPEPIYTCDLVTGLSPDGHTLIVRAGSPLNTDEFALYQIDLPSTEVTKITPLLSLSIQREIISGEDEQALAVFSAVTRDDGLAWSADGRYLAFTAALESSTSDLYIYNAEKDSIGRVNGLYTQSASPFWAPEGNWLVNQELSSADSETGWRADVVEVFSIPGYADQSALYVPGGQSQGEVFLGWINIQSFISYSQTADGAQMLRQVNVEDLSVGIRYQGSFEEAALDPDSGCLALILSDEDASELNLMGGVYLLQADSTTPELQRAGEWENLKWDEGGVFVTSGSQGVFTFTPEGEGLILQDESDIIVSPSGNWMIGWGDGVDGNAGARLYQSSGNLLQQLMEQIVSLVYWLPDSQSFYIQAEGVLYYLAFPDLTPVEVEAGFSSDTLLDLVWVE